MPNEQHFIFVQSEGVKKVLLGMFIENVSFWNVIFAFESLFVWYFFSIPKMLCMATRCRWFLLTAFRQFLGLGVNEGWSCQWVMLVHRTGAHWLILLWLHHWSKRQLNLLELVWVAPILFLDPERRLFYSWMHGPSSACLGKNVGGGESIVRIFKVFCCY